ncbi:MAG: hypothetical protein JNK79_02310 [Chitinophagaceae bacterium]|nr:hypothetical protein [Chitinophagaceae bacterium]
MKPFLFALLAIILISCGDSGEDITSQQLQLQSKIDSIDQVHDSLSTIIETSSDMRTDELVRMQLLIKKLDEERAYLLKSYDSLEKQLRRN